MEPYLRSEIVEELRKIGTRAPATLRRALIEKLFEIFVFTCVVRALKAIGAQLTTKDKLGNPTNNLVFRLAPGYIHAPTTSPGFIHVSYRGKEYEIQNSIRVCGRSKIMHELDVSLIDESGARKSRFSGTKLSQSSVKFIAECKYYGSRLDLSIGREVLGLSKEFGAPKIKTIVSNIANDEIHTMVTVHDITENFEVTPLNPDKVDLFVKWLSNELRQIQ